MAKTEELRDLSDEELEFRRETAQKELFDLKNRMKKNSKDEKGHFIPLKRREIARILTLIHERKLAQVSS
jgi:ribosomal protein L29